VRFDVKLNLVPDLATRWTQSADGLTWTFFLRKGVRFHDGTPCNAEAVKYTFDRFLGAEKPLRASLHEPIIKRVEVVDAYTVRFTLKVPFSFFLNNLAHSASAIVSPAAHRRWGKDLTLHPVGTGPFKFVEWARGDHLTLGRNEDYYEGRPHLERIVVKTVQEDSARVLGLEAGDYDLIVRIPPEEVPRLMREGRIRIYAEQSNRTLRIGINTSKKPFDDMRVRQALNYAVDKEAIVRNIYQGLAMVIPTMVGPLNAGYAPVKGYPYDPAKAKQLLTEAGYGSGFKTTLWTPKGRFLKDFELAQAVQQQLGAIGIDVKLEPLEWGAYLSLLRKPREESKHELFLQGWSPSTGEARWGMYPLTGCDQWQPSGGNSAYYCNRDVDRMIDQAVASRNVRERDAYMRRAQELLVQDPSSIYLLATKETVGMSMQVHGVINSPLELVYADKDTWKEK
ncbi:MAG TPA: ABC transporter substrate-binding protein, partial [Candidatus Acidoferrum sp.]|nr:ABC transporter substrate-binding protein [Candidatus Acidoferrum sp.]